ncbi:MAG: DedA family protein [Planctomycetes bacterium]|jgi:membrane protein YqaA with SNARE-associated domain|nr:DedA family protein [Planctomycetota bacterium]
MPIDAQAAYCDHCGNKLGPRRRVPWYHLHRRVYDWTLAWAYRPSAQIALFILSFAESSFFPVPPDVLLMPLVLGNRRKWLRLASICTAASVLGAIAGFLIGALLWQQVGGFFHDHIPGFARDTITLVDGSEVHGLIDRDSLSDGQATYPLTIDGKAQSFEQSQVSRVDIQPFTKVGSLYEKYNFWIVFTAGFTPIPFKVITITAGVFGTGASVSNPWSFFAVFLVAAIISRGGRFFLVAGLMRVFGPKITPFIDKYFNLLALLFTALLIGGFVAIKYVF